MESLAHSSSFSCDSLATPSSRLSRSTSFSNESDLDSAEEFLVHQHVAESLVLPTLSVDSHWDAAGYASSESALWDIETLEDEHPWTTSDDDDDVGARGGELSYSTGVRTFLDQLDEVGQGEMFGRAKA